MTHEPLTRWRCDVCEKWITSAEDGYVLWEVEPNGVCDFQIVHQGECDADIASRSEALPSFLGPNGLARLTAFLSLGPARPGSRPVHATDADGWVDLVRRVQLPFYEEARAELQRKSAAGEYGGWNEAAPYLQENLRGLANPASD